MSSCRRGSSQLSRWRQTKHRKSAWTDRWSVCSMGPLKGLEKHGWRKCCWGMKVCNVFDDSYLSLAASFGQRLTDLIRGWPLCRSKSVLALSGGAPGSAPTPEWSHYPWSSWTGNLGYSLPSTRNHTGFPLWLHPPLWSPLRMARLLGQIQ